MAGGEGVRADVDAMRTWAMGGGRFRPMRTSTIMTAIQNRKLILSIVKDPLVYFIAVILSKKHLK